MKTLESSPDGDGDGDGRGRRIICAQQLNNRSGVWAGASPLAPNPALGIDSDLRRT
jgi:hypothetical protein